MKMYAKVEKIFNFIFSFDNFFSRGGFCVSRQKG